MYVKLTERTVLRQRRPTHNSFPQLTLNERYGSARPARYDLNFFSFGPCSFPIAVIIPKVNSSDWSITILTRCSRTRLDPLALTVVHDDSSAANEVPSKYSEGVHRSFDSIVKAKKKRRWWVLDLLRATSQSHSSQMR